MYEKGRGGQKTPFLAGDILLVLYQMLGKKLTYWPILSDHPLKRNPVQQILHIGYATKGLYRGTLRGGYRISERGGGGGGGWPTVLLKCVQSARTRATFFPPLYKVLGSRKWGGGGGGSLH